MFIRMLLSETFMKKTCIPRDAPQSRWRRGYWITTIDRKFDTSTFVHLHMRKLLVVRTHCLCMWLKKIYIYHTVYRECTEKYILYSTFGEKNKFRHETGNALIHAFPLYTNSAYRIKDETNDEGQYLITVSIINN